jgi:hypothetical protein
MTTPIKGTSWACGNCKKPYPHAEMAKKCCTCRDCGGTEYAEYVGTSQQRCRKCAIKGSLEHNLKYAEDVAAQIALTREEAERYGLEIIEYIDGKVEVRAKPGPDGSEKKRRRSR